MTTIYLIRHAEAEGNLYRIAQGQYNSGITTRGRQQIHALARRFLNIHVDAVYSSDLYRACVTASAIYKLKNLPLHRCPNLREICVGEWEGKTWGEIARDQPEQLRNFTRSLHLWHVDQCESPQHVQDRMLDALHSILDAHEGQTVAVVSHGCAIRLLLSALEGESLEELSGSTGENTAVSRIEAEGDQIRVVFRDDSSHLQDPAFGEPVKKRASALEPGLYFEPLDLNLSEHRGFLTSCVHTYWTDRGHALTDQHLLEDAAQRPTLIGFLEDEPVGVIQFNPDKEADCGWISLCCVQEPYRNRGYGAQLLGQAVNYYRELGVDCLRIALSAGDPAKNTFREQGFTPVGMTKSGRRIWEKSIAMVPEYLSSCTNKM